MAHPTGPPLAKYLLLTLRDSELPATLFINQRWAQANPRTMEEIVSQSLFEIQNHGTKHLPLSVSGQSAYGIKSTTSVAEAYDEIMINQRFLQSEYGLDGRYSCSGTAHVDEVSAQICNDLGLTPVNFTVNLERRGYACRRGSGVPRGGPVQVRHSAGPLQPSHFRHRGRSRAGIAPPARTRASLHDLGRVALNDERLRQVLGAVSYLLPIILGFDTAGRPVNRVRALRAPAPDR